MRGLRVFLAGLTLVMFVTNMISIDAGKGNSWTAVVIGCMSMGAYLALMLVHSQGQRRK